MSSGNLNAGGFKFRMRHGKRLVKESVWGNCFQGGFALAENGSQALDDIRGADISAYDILQNFTQFIQVGVFVGHQALCGLCVAENDGKRLIDLMSQ